MASLGIKIIMVPVGLIVASWLFPNVDYAEWHQPVALGLILAVLGVLMEYLILKKGTLWLSTLADFAVSALVIYYVSNVFDGAVVTFFGSLLAAALLAVAEHFLHRWLIRTGRTLKSPAS